MGLLKNLIFRLRGDYTLEQLYALGLTAGKRFNPQQGFYLDPSHCWLITIGDNVTFGPHVTVLAHDASMHGALGYTRIAPVTIGNRVFIGADTTVLPGVTIGDDAIIGAGSVVTKSIPTGEVWAGNPARKIANTADFLEKHRNHMKNSPCYGEEFTLRQDISDEKKAQQKAELASTAGYVI